MVSHYRQRGGRALTHNDGAHNEHTQKTKMAPAHKERQQTEDKQISAENTELGLSQVTVVLLPNVISPKGIHCPPDLELGEMFLPNPSQNQLPSSANAGPRSHAGCQLPPAHSLGLGLTLARTTNSPLIRPNKSQLPSSAYAGPRPHAGLNQT